MPKLSKETAPDVKEFPMATDRSGDLDGYTFNFVTIHQSHDLGPILAQLPAGNCQCPHWGYLSKGQMTVRYGDREEVIEAGDAFYMPPGHAPEAVAGTEILQISPANEFAELQSALMNAMQAQRS